MGLNQIVAGAALVAALLGLTGFYGWRQVAALRRLRGPTDLSPEEATWRRRQAWRRLVGCGLMLALAVLLALVLIFMEGPSQQILDQGAEFTIAPEQRPFIRLYFAVWIAILLLLLAIVLLAGVDLWSTRRFTVQQLRRIQADRRAMIEQQLQRHRRERNGQG